MQTFLPYPDFIKSAKVLDNKRLNKQITEGYQILRAITDSTYGWQNHPIVNMWRGHEVALAEYINTVHGEYYLRTGKSHKSYELAWAYYRSYKITSAIIHPQDPPKWLGHKPFHLSHRLNLIRKDPELYGKAFLNPGLHGRAFVDVESMEIYTPEHIKHYPYLWYDTKQGLWYTTNKGKKSYLPKLEEIENESF